MPIWIKTQNNRLKECIEISQPVRFDLRDGKVEYKIFGFGNFEDNGTTLGTYQTEEKALKVIDEIWERIQPIMQVKNVNGVNEIEVINKTNCYVMPKE